MHNDQGPEARTTATWWAATKNDPQALNAWLEDQHRGEATAATRIEALRDAFTTQGTRPHRILTLIAAQERTHAGWVAELLAARGLPTTIATKRERYWPRALAPIHDLATGAAIGAHAERMRLERIEAIAADPDAPADIRAVF